MVVPAGIDHRVVQPVNSSTVYPDKKNLMRGQRRMLGGAEGGGDRRVGERLLSRASHWKGALCGGE